MMILHNMTDSSISGVTLLCAAPLLIEICRPYPPLKFRVPKKKKKKRSGTFFAAPYSFLPPTEAKVVPQIFFSRRPNAKLDREVHQ